MINSFPDFLDQSVDDVARQLLGCELQREIDGQVVRVRIVETESYDQHDEASHAFGGKRTRNAVMFGPSGRLYVYFTYGMHYCCNIVTGMEGYGSGVLIRAVEPVLGAGILERRRGMTGVNITNGPAKLTQALGIDLSMNGHDLHTVPLQLLSGSRRADEIVMQSPRIGISRAVDVPRRFYIRNNSYVTRHRHGY